MTVLPKIHIETAGGAAVANTEDYIDATVRVVSETGAETLQATTEIRGNTRWAGRLRATERANHAAAVGRTLTSTARDIFNAAPEQPAET
jgi:hypothetical protein